MAQVAEMVERVLELRGGVFRRAFGEAACEGGASRSAGVAREPPPQSLSDSSPALRGSYASSSAASVHTCRRGIAAWIFVGSRSYVR